MQSAGQRSRTSGGPGADHRVEPVALPPLEARTQLARNRWLTWLLAVGFLVSVAWIVVPVALLTRSWLAATLLSLGLISFVAVASSLFTWVALKAAGAHRLAADDFPQLEKAVSAMCGKLGIPSPILHVVEDPSLNAFALGPNPAHAHITFTRGNLMALNEGELEAVAAHELGHIVHRDTPLYARSFALLGWVRLSVRLADWVMDVVDAIPEELATRPPANLVGVLAAIGHILLAGLMILADAALALWSIVARLLERTICRRREYMADAFAAELTDPLALASALLKAEAGPELARGEAIVGSLCILHSEFRRHWWDDLFSTHPSTEARVAALWRMAEARKVSSSGLKRSQPETGGAP